MGHRRIGAIALASFLSVGTLEAQSRTPSPSSTDGVALASLASSGIAVDGVDSEVAWAEAVTHSGFREFSPEQDAEPSFPTEFKVVYSADDLFFFVRAYDPHPDSIMRALARRDQWAPADQVGIIIDSYDDRRTGFSFYTNPDGVQRDFAIYDDGNEDASWNGVWDVATTVDSLGWTAEFRIPLSQLRYSRSDEQVFGFGVRRGIQRYPEELSWPLYSRTDAGLVSQLGRLHGLEQIGAARRLELSPYALTKSITRELSTGDGFENVEQAAVGGDLKLGIGPNITLDATINPDFGQVEADPAVLNLSAFETFYGERRPFFLEGTGLYRFALNCYIVVDCQTNEGLFYSRRIGRAPGLGGLYGDQTTPTATPIAGALKLTGRRPGGLSFGVLDAVTAGVQGTGGNTAEPRTNYAVVRVQQDLMDGDAGIGWIATAVNRSLDPSTSPYMHGSAYVTGVNVRSRFGERRYEVYGALSASRVSGSPDAIARTQRGSTHYFQRPDDELELDLDRTSLSGYDAQVKVGKYAGGITRFETSYVQRSPGFDPNDLGYLRRADIRDWSTWASLSFQDPTRFYRWARLNANTWHHWGSDGTRLEAATNFNAHAGLHNNWDLHAGATSTGLAESYCDRCTRGGPSIRSTGGTYPWFGVNGDNRRLIVPSMWVNLGYWDEGASRNRSLSPSLTIRPSTSLSVRVGANYFTQNNDSQWFGNFEDEGGATHYSVARLDQRTVSVNLRVSYTVTPDLSFEFYGEPFTSSGEYTDVREVVDPTAPRYVDRFAPYSPPEEEALMFSARQLRTNAVVRWEYRPGSTLFLVWAHGRDGYLENQPRRPWTRDFGGLLDLHPDNTFLVKVSYWFNP